MRPIPCPACPVARHFSFMQNLWKSSLSNPPLQHLSIAASAGSAATAGRLESGSTSGVRCGAVGHGEGGAPGLSALSAGGIRLDVQRGDRRHQILLVGNDCVSKDVAAKLRRAGYSLAKFDTVPAGIEAAAAVRFDFAVIDADGMGPNDLANVREAFMQRGISAVAVMRCEAGAARAANAESETAWRLLEKPVPFETLVGT